MKRNELIKKLSDAFGPSGFEEEVVQVLREELKDTSYTLSSDQMKNFYATKEKEGLRIMLDAHTDEVSFIIKSILPNGMLSFLTLGSISANNLGAQRVLIRNEKGELLPGVIASIPPHFQSEADRKAPPQVENLLIDLGVSSADQIREMGVDVGSPGIFDVKAEVFEDRGLAFGKAFDCRIGCVALVETLKALEGEDKTILGSFSVQEEVGVRGATVSARRLKPDVAIVFEGAPADDTFGKDYDMGSKLKHGPMLRHVDVRMISSPSFMAFAKEVAKEEGIDIQCAVRSGGGTNGAAIHLSNEGVPTIVMSIPVRYIHTANCWTALSDLEGAVQLATAIVKRLDQKLLDSWLV